MTGDDPRDLRRRVRAVRFLGPAPRAAGRGWRVMGQDGGQSIDLGGGRTFFLFADSLLSADGAGGGGAQVLLANCGAVGTGSTLPDALASLRYRLDERGRPRAILPERDDERRAHLRFWPAHGLRMADGTLLVFYLGIRFVNPRSSWGFRNLGAGLARVDPRTGDSERLPAPGGGWCWWPAHGDDLHFGVQVLREGDDAFVFLSSRDGLHSHASVARVPVARLKDRAAYRFLTPERTWSPDIAMRASLGRASNDYSVSWNAHLGAYLMVFVDVYTKVLHLRLAERPEGPWGDPVALGKLPHQPGSELVYLAFEHPHLAKDRGRTVYVSYCEPHFQQNGLVAVTFV